MTMKNLLESLRTINEDVYTDLDAMSDEDLAREAFRHDVNVDLGQEGLRNREEVIQHLTGQAGHMNDTIGDEDLGPTVYDNDPWGLDESELNEYGEDEFDRSPEMYNDRGAEYTKNNHSNLVNIVNDYDQKFMHDKAYQANNHEWMSAMEVALDDAADYSDDEAETYIDDLDTDILIHLAELGDQLSSALGESLEESLTKEFNALNEDAYDNGFQAGYKGKDNNPHDQGSKEYEEYEDGYREGRRDRRNEERYDESKVNEGAFKNSWSKGDTVGTSLGNGIIKSMSANQEKARVTMTDGDLKGETHTFSTFDFRKSSVSEGGMPSSVIKSKQRLADMSDDEFRSKYGSKSEKTLQQMAWRHGYGKMSDHYVKRLGNVKEGYTIMPNIDRERYTAIPDLEGPFQTKSGKVVYYDPKMGKYYDRDSDMYLSDKEYFEYDKQSQFAQDPVEEAIVDYDDENYPFTDDRTGELFKTDPRLDDSDDVPHSWANDYDEPVEEAIVDYDDPNYPFTDDETGEVFQTDPRLEKEPNRMRRPGLNAEAEFADVAAGGGDAIDHLITNHEMSMEEIDRLAQDNGYADANEWADSFVNESVTEMFSTGATGFQVYNVDETVYDSLIGTFPNATVEFNAANGTATVLFDEPVTDEIDAKMDRFKSNWQVKTDAIRESAGTIVPNKTPQPAQSTQSNTVSTDDEDDAEAMDAIEDEAEDNPAVDAELQKLKDLAGVK